MSLPADFPAPPGECAETSGFLFQHRCGEYAKNECGGCHKAICERHTVLHGAATYCTTCARAQLQTNAGGGAYPAGRPYADNPYFYGHYYYPGYHYGFGFGHGHSHSPHDFTAGEERALQGGEPDAQDLPGFAGGMGAS